MRGWRNRQTRWIQVPVPERAWGFNSPLAHHRSPGLRTWGALFFPAAFPLFLPLFLPLFSRPFSQAAFSAVGPLLTAGFAGAFRVPRPAPFAL